MLKRGDFETESDSEIYPEQFARDSAGAEYRIA